MFTLVFCRKHDITSKLYQTGCVTASVMIVSELEIVLERDHNGV